MALEYEWLCRCCCYRLPWFEAVEALFLLQGLAICAIIDLHKEKCPHFVHMSAEKLLQRKILQNIQERKMDNYYIISWIYETFSGNDGLPGHGQQPHGRCYRRCRGCSRRVAQEVKLLGFPSHGERGSPPPAGCFFSHPKCFAFLSHGRRYRRCGRRSRRGTQEVEKFLVSEISLQI